MVLVYIELVLVNFVRSTTLIVDFKVVDFKMLLDAAPDGVSALIV